MQEEAEAAFEKEAAIETSTAESEKASSAPDVESTDFKVAFHLVMFAFVVKVVMADGHELRPACCREAQR